jgi:hypothetical protein
MKIILGDVVVSLLLWSCWMMMACSAVANSDNEDRVTSSYHGGKQRHLRNTSTDCVSSRSTKSPSSGTKSPTGTKSPKSNSVLCTTTTTPPPPTTTSSSFGCMSGETGIPKITQDGNIEITKITDLVAGDLVKGKNAALEDSNECSVVSVMRWSEGPMYGNYTENHYMLDLETSSMVYHEAIGPQTYETSYLLLTTCPVVKDESGKFFAPLDGDHTAFNILKGPLLWEEYMAPYSLHLNLVSRLLHQGVRLDSSSFVDGRRLEKRRMIFTDVVHPDEEEERHRQRNLKRRMLFQASTHLGEENVSHQMTAYDVMLMCAQNKIHCGEAKDYMESHIEVEFVGEIHSAFRAALGFPWPDDEDYIHQELSQLFSFDKPKDYM